jgi:sugar transferase (PEP-CTERM/EpsH1 system associated)
LTLSGIPPGWAATLVVARMHEAQKKDCTEGALRIVHIVLDLHEGGLERLVTDLVRAGAHAGYEPHVVCLRRAGRLAAELTTAQYTIVPRQNRLSMLAPLQASRLLRRLSPDIVHLHSGVWFKGAYASRLAGARRVIFTDHGRPHPDPLTHRLLDGLGARMSDRVVAVSAPLAEYLATRLRVPRAKLRVIPNGILLPPSVAAEELAAVRRQLRIPAGAQVVGTVGRLDPVKAYDRLILAFAELHRAAAPPAGPMVLLLVGDGPERPRLEQLAQAAGVADAVRFLGWRKDVHRLLGLMDAFVLPSESEGTSLSLLEAMAAGVPVIATAVGGTPDVLGDSGAGLLVPPGDLPALVGALKGLLRDPERRKSLGSKGRARVEQHYSFGAMARAYDELYHELLPNG